MDRSRIKRLQQVSVRVLAALGITLALSGCIIEPLWGPHYHRHYHGGY